MESWKQHQYSSSAGDFVQELKNSTPERNHLQLYRRGSTARNMPLFAYFSVLNNNLC
jgi:hypothetical protein